MDNNPAPMSSEALAKEGTANPQQPNPNPGSQPPNPVKPASKFSIKAIIGIIIFLLLAGGAAASFTVFKPQIMSLVTKTTPTQTVSATPFPTQDPTADWKTFKGDGFSFKYPLELIEGTSSRSIGGIVFDTTEHFDSITFLSDMSSFRDVQKSNQVDIPYRYRGVQIIIYSKTSGSKYLDSNFYTEKISKNFQNDYGVLYKPTINEVEINNRKWLHVTGFGTLPVNYYVLKLQNNSILILNKMESEIGDFDKEFDQILSTFKFTDEQTQDTSTWRIYEGNGFSFMYPPEYVVSKESNDSIIFDGKFGDTKIKEVLRVNTNNTININNYQICEDPPKTNSACLTENPKDRIINGNTFKEFVLAGDKILETGASARYVAQLAGGQPMEFVIGIYSDSGNNHMIKIPTDENRILSTLKFTN